jgi:hypothetical protein
MDIPAATALTAERYHRRGNLGISTSTGRKTPR